LYILACIELCRVTIQKAYCPRVKEGDSMNINELDNLSRLNVEAICNSEEDVKMKFIVPLLKALGHEENIYYESDRMDIIIKGAPYKTSMLIEAKHHSKQLRDSINQLNDYWTGIDQP